MARITFEIPDSERTALKIMCVLTHKTMSQFIRIAVKDRIKELKETENEK